MRTRRLTWGPMQHLRGWNCVLHGAIIYHGGNMHSGASERDAAGAHIARALSQQAPTAEHGAPVCCFSSFDNSFESSRIWWLGPAQRDDATCPLINQRRARFGGARGWKSRSHFLSLRFRARTRYSLFPQIDVCAFLVGGVVNKACGETRGNPFSCVCGLNEGAMVFLSIYCL